MKVALCVSGIPTKEMEDKKTEQLLNLKKYLPYDTFVHTWKWVKPYFPADYPAKINTSEMIPLPVSKDGLTFFDISQKTFEGTKWEDYAWSKWWHKYNDRIITGEKSWRFFNHWENLKYVNSTYDVIIRTDFECLVDDFIWEELIVKCYKEGTTFGVNHASHNPSPEHDLGESSYQYRGDLKEFIYEDLIIHRHGKMKNPYEELLKGNLDTSEKGWYKLLGPDNYQNISTTSLELVRFQEFIKL